jgi:hypothetical protein
VSSFHREFLCSTRSFFRFLALLGFDCLLIGLPEIVAQRLNSCQSVAFLFRRIFPIFQVRKGCLLGEGPSHFCDNGRTMLAPLYFREQPVKQIALGFITGPTREKVL